MAKLTRQKIKQIVERDMPGYTAVEPPAAAADVARPEAPPEVITPEIAELRRQFLGADADTNAPFYGAISDAGQPANADDSMIVLTRPKDPPVDAASAGAGPKAVVIAG